MAARHGGFITTCPIHTTAIHGYTHRIEVRGVSMYQALSDWVWETHGPGPKPYWTYDVPWPRDTSCPSPSASADEQIPAALDVKQDSDNSQSRASVV